MARSASATGSRAVGRWCAWRHGRLSLLECPPCVRQFGSAAPACRRRGHTRPSAETSPGNWREGRPEEAGAPTTTFPCPHAGLVQRTNETSIPPQRREDQGKQRAVIDAPTAADRERHDRSIALPGAHDRQVLGIARQRAPGQRPSLVFRWVHVFPSAHGPSISCRSSSRSNPDHPAVRSPGEFTLFGPPPPPLTCS